MPTSTSTNSPSNSTTTYIRGWASAITSALQSSGWVRTSDTGQTESNALPVPGAINTAVGYQIWTMSDDLQSSYPIYLKIEFGSGAAIQTPCVWLTVGTGSTGSGQLNGRVSPRITAKSSANSTSAYTCGFSGDSSSFQCAMFANAAANILSFFSIERSRDYLGNLTPDGIIVQCFDSASAGQQYFLPLTGTLYNYVLPFNYLPPTGASSLANGNDVTLLPLIPYDLNTVYSPGLSMMIYLSADFPSGAYVPVTSGNGVTHFYWISRVVISGIYKLALRWE